MEMFFVRFLRGNNEDVSPLAFADIVAEGDGIVHGLDAFPGEIGIRPYLRVAAYVSQPEIAGFPEADEESVEDDQGEEKKSENLFYWFGEVKGKTFVQPDCTGGRADIEEGEGVQEVFFPKQGLCEEKDADNNGGKKKNPEECGPVFFGNDKRREENGDEQREGKAAEE